MFRALASLTVGFSLLLAMPLIVAMAAAGGFHQPSREAIDEIPPVLLTIYQDASATRCPGLSWSILAAIGKIESDHGRMGGAEPTAAGRIEPPIIGVALDGNDGTRLVPDSDAGRYDGDTTYDRAVGPMQFIPTTWARSGLDASGDGLADPHNAVDSIHAAAVYLCHHGAADPESLPDAVWTYNQSWSYVQRVLTLSDRYAIPMVRETVASPTLVAMVLENPRLEIYSAGRADIAAGHIDARVLLLLQLASEHHSLTISSLKTGHSRCVGGHDYDGCRVSRHWHGRAVDIAVVDGEPVAPTNQAARRLAVWFGGHPGALAADEIGTPWRDLGAHPYFHDAQHLDHLHIGYGTNHR